MMSTETPPRAGRSANRSGDTDASAAAASGLTSHNQVSLDCAAKLSLLSDSGRMFDCHSKTAPHEPFFRICSADHNASAELFGRSHRTFRSFKRQDRQVMVWGRYGGCMKATRCWRDSVAKAGLSNCISPIPCCCTNSSTSAERGQPSLGSSEFNTPCPVDMVGARDTASWSARHTLVRRAWSRAA